MKLDTSSLAQGGVQHFPDVVLVGQSPSSEMSERRTAKTDKRIDESRNGTCLTTRNLMSLPKRNAIPVLATIAAIEKKSFPSNEAFSFDAQMLNKHNTRVLYVSDKEANTSVVAYCVPVRFRRILLLHKICVAERSRNQGIGRYLMAEILNYAEGGGSSGLELRVDPSRVIAVKLYTQAGLSEQCLINDYYAPGRDGIKMSIQLPRQVPGGTNSHPLQKI